MRSVYLAICVTALSLMATWKVACAQDSLGVSRLAYVDYWKITPYWRDGYAPVLQVMGNYAYVSAWQSGLHIMDLSDATHPVEVGRQPWAPWCLQDVTLYVQDTLLFVSYFHPGNGSHGTMLNVSNPANPVEMHTWLTTWEDPLDDTDPYLVFVHNNIAVGLQGTEIPYPFLMDVSDWDHPVYAYNFYSNFPVSYPLGMAGDYLCMAGSGVMLFDVSNPYAPVEVGSLNDPNLGGYALIDSACVYITAGSGMHVIDVSNPSQPSDVDSFDSGSCTGLQRIGTVLYVFKLDGTINRWDVSDPRHPQYSGTTVLPAGCSTFVGSANRWCSPLDSYCSDQALAVLDPSNPAAPVDVSHFGRNGHPVQIAVSGAVLCVSDLYSGFRTYDWSNPQQLHELGRAAPCLDYQQTGGMAARDHYIYEARDTYGLLTFDITDPSHPESLACWQGPAMNGVTIYGDSVYVGWSGFIAVLSLANPAAPQIVDSLPYLPACAAEECPCQGDYMYCRTDGDAFGVYDLATGRVGWCNLQGNEFGARYTRAVVSGNYCYVAAVGGVNIVDVSNPYSPIVVNLLGSLVEWVALSGQTLIYYDYDPPQLHVIDVSDPVHPQEIGHYDTGQRYAEVTDMKIVGRDKVMMVNEGQVAIYQIDALDAAHPRQPVPHEFALHPAFPNPFNPSTVIEFSLPKSERAKLTVYDIMGRKVKVLMDDVLTAGEHRVTFDGTGLASGIYFAKIEAGGVAKVQKMVLLK